MTKTEYMNTINEKLTAAEALCADLRKLRGLQKLAQSITGQKACQGQDRAGRQGPQGRRYPGGLTGGDVHDLPEDSVLCPARHPG